MIRFSADDDVDHANKLCEAGLLLTSHEKKKTELKTTLRMDV